MNLERNLHPNTVRSNKGVQIEKSKELKKELFCNLAFKYMVFVAVLQLLTTRFEGWVVISMPIALHFITASVYIFVRSKEAYRDATNNSLKHKKLVPTNIVPWTNRNMSPSANMSAYKLIFISLVGIFVLLPVSFVFHAKGFTLSPDLTELALEVAFLFFSISFFDVFFETGWIRIKDWENILKLPRGKTLFHDITFYSLILSAAAYHIKFLLGSCSLILNTIN
ncbi:MAG: hypothetical protein RR915_02190 [Cellulosilyticaceae bacterium]